MPVTQVGEASRIRVLVAEHHPILREGICRLLSFEPDFEVIGAAADGPESVALTRRHRPDVLVLEFDLPRMTGLRVLELLQPTAATRVLLVGAAITSSTAVEALELGARGVLHHDDTPGMLFKGIRAVARGEYWVRRSLLGDLLSRVAVSSDPFELTAREREIVELVVRGYSNKAIAGHCGITADTVKHHLTSIFDKTGASTRVELAVFALHHGVAAAGMAAEPPARGVLESVPRDTPERRHGRATAAAAHAGAPGDVPVPGGTNGALLMAD